MHVAFSHGETARHNNPEEQQEQALPGRFCLPGKDELEKGQKLIDKRGDENKTVHAALLG